MIGLKDPIQNWLKILHLSQQNVDKKGLVRGEKKSSQSHKKKNKQRGINW
jgi:hypothetical protein